MGCVVKATVLLSGGLDSATALAWCVRLGWECEALAFDYGQEHGPSELPRAEKIAARYGVRFTRLDLPRLAADAGPAHVYPGRNLIMLTVAASLGATTLVIGSNRDDQEDYPDCRPIFFRALEEALTFSGGRRVSICAPFVEVPKAGVVGVARELGVPIGETWSCYHPTPYLTAGDVPCWSCNACALRRKAGA